MNRDVCNYSTKSLDFAIFASQHWGYQFIETLKSIPRAPPLNLTALATQI